MTLSLREPRTLDELLNYRLQRLYTASSAPVIRLMEGRWGITHREWRLIAVMAAQGGMSPSTLAERSHLDRARTSLAITSLVAKKLVKRAPQQGDGRRAHVELSAQGHRLFSKIFPQVASINARVISVLDDTTAEALDRALTLLTSHAILLNGEVAVDVQADRRGGGSRRLRGGFEAEA
jgi:DNA-binding MarR family transcriptional regulator